VEPCSGRERRACRRGGACGKRRESSEGEGIEQRVEEAEMSAGRPGRVHTKARCARALLTSWIPVGKFLILAVLDMDFVKMSAEMDSTQCKEVSSPRD
jgi:hypothetical protein